MAKLVKVGSFHKLSVPEIGLTGKAGSSVVFNVTVAL